MLASGFSNEPEYDSAGQLPLHYATRHRAKVAKALFGVRSGLRVNSKTKILQLDLIIFDFAG